MIPRTNTRKVTCFFCISGAMRESFTISIRLAMVESAVMRDSSEYDATFASTAFQATRFNRASSEYLTYESHSPA